MPLFPGSSLFGAKKEWDTNFARLYLKIPDDELKFLNSLHVDSSVVVENKDKTTEKERNPTTIETCLPSPQTVNPVIAINESNTVEQNSKTLSNTLSLTSDPVSGKSKTEPTSANTRQSLSSYFSKVVGVFSRHKRKRSNSASDLHVPSVKEGLSTSKSEDDLVEILRNSSTENLLLPNKVLDKESGKDHNTAYKDQVHEIHTSDKQTDKSSSPVKSPEKSDLIREKLLNTKLRLLEKRLCPTEKHVLETKSSINDVEKMEVASSQEPTKTGTASLLGMEASVSLSYNKENNSDVSDAIADTSKFVGVQNEKQVEGAGGKLTPNASSDKSCFVNYKYDPVIIRLTTPTDSASLSYLPSSGLPNSINKPEKEFISVESSTTIDATSLILGKNSSTKPNLINHSLKPLLMTADTNNGMSKPQQNSNVPNSTNQPEKKSPAKSQGIEISVSPFSSKVLSSNMSSSSQSNLLNEPKIKSLSKSTESWISPRKNIPDQPQKCEDSSQFCLPSLSDICSSAQSKTLHQLEVPHQNTDHSLSQPEVRFQKPDNFSYQLKVQLQKSDNFLSQLEIPSLHSKDNGRSQLQKVSPEKTNFPQHSKDIRSSQLQSVSPEKSRISQHSKDIRSSQLQSVSPEKSRISQHSKDIRSSQLQSVSPEKSRISQHYKDIGSSQLQSDSPEKSLISQHSALLPFSNTDSFQPSDSLYHHKVVPNTNANETNSANLGNDGATYSVFSQNPYGQVTSPSSDVIKTSLKRKRPSKGDQKSRKKISFSNCAVDIQYTASQVMSMIEVMKMLQSQRL